MRDWIADKTPSSPVAIASVSMDVWPERVANVLWVTLSGGFGLRVEHTYDSQTFDCEFRAGGTAANRDAEAMAWWFDSLWIDNTTPFEIGGYRVIDTYRVGGPPQRRRMDDSGRVYWGAPYGCLIARQ